MIAFDLAQLDFDRNGGFVTVIAQHAVTGAVLMTARADPQAVRLTIETGEMHYHSRQRGLWRKGETSGNRQAVRSLHADCDGDALLALVVPMGPACHTGQSTCFGDTARAGFLAELDQRIAARAAAGDTTSYTARLLADRNLRLKKLGEEAGELAIACADGDAAAATREAADLLYHSLVALRALGAGLEDVVGELAGRSR